MASDRKTWSVRSNTWHYFFWAQAHSPDRLPTVTSLCSYFWTTLGMIIVDLILTCLTLLFLGGLAGTIYYEANWPDFVTGITFLGIVLAGLAVAITGVCLIVAFLRWLWTHGIIQLLLGMPKIPVPPHVEVVVVPSYKRKGRKKPQKKTIQVGWSLRSMPEKVAMITCPLTISLYSAFGAYAFGFPAWQGFLVPVTVVLAVVLVLIAICLAIALLIAIIAIPCLAVNYLWNRRPELSEDSFLVLGFSALRALKHKLCPIIHIVEV